MNVGSLFSGIGGFDYGLERAGMRVVWQCEADEFCRRVLARHWPGVPCYPDVRELRAVDVEPVDVLCGGFPCQDISLAGRGAGIEGARSGLWGEYARLVRELRPRYVIVENVAALLARGLGTVVGDLAACGYDTEWDCVPASAVGAPHRRDRLWLIAYPHGSGRESGLVDLQAGQPDAEGRGAGVADSERGGRQGRPQDTGRGSSDGQAVEWREGSGEFARRGTAGRDPELADPDGEGRARWRRGHGLDAAPHGTREDDRVAGSGRPGGDVQDADGSPLQPWRVGGRAAQAGGSEWWAAEPPVGRVAHGVPDRLDQLAALGNALVPQIAEWLGGRILEWESLTA